MQDVQNIPNPDVNSIEDDGDFGSHSDFPNTDVEQPKEETPPPPDRLPHPAIEEPPEDEDGNDDNRRKQIL
ncbi:MAG TPA: hypothetical protein VNI84_10450 [Pyrinomonadaceae bacterium]|nr:hypothetical protein [Pyrinomonadaceae bacterium]